MTDVSQPDPAELAAEYALGVLPLEEHRAAEARALSDSAFGRAALAWSERLSPLLDEIASVTPSPGLWARIEAGLGLGARPRVDSAPVAPRRGEAESDLQRLTRSRAGWRVAALGALAAAVACIVVLCATVFRPPSPTPSPLIARLSPTTGAAPVVAVYEPARRTILISLPAHLTPPGRAAELWLIDASGKPTALGVARSREASVLAVPPALAMRLLPQVVLAVSIEPRGGSPTGLPTGPVVAKGALSQT